MSQFCNSHKRWFNDQCDYCEREERERLSRSTLYKTARDWSILLAVHAECNHLITDVLLCADGYHRTVLHLQLLAFEAEHAEVR